jgi:undecaprenyl-diphosphatase
MDTLLDLDIYFFRLINQAGTSFWDPFFLFVTNKWSWIPLYAFLVFLIFKKKKQNAIITLLFITLVIVISDQGSVHLFKNVFERLRPCHFLDHVRLVTDGCGGNFGFISSHASNVFGLAIFIGSMLHKKTFAFLFFWAALVSFSRVYLGVHYPLDILFGMMYGSTVALLLLKIFNKYEKSLTNFLKNTFKLDETI